MATAVQNERDKIIRRNPAAAAGAKAARSASTSSFGSPAESKSLGGGGPGGGQGGGTPTWTQGGGGSSPYPSPSHAAPHTPTNGGSGVPLPIPAPTLAELLSTLNASHEVCLFVCTEYVKAFGVKRGPARPRVPIGAEQRSAEQNVEPRGGVYTLHRNALLTDASIAPRLRAPVFALQNGRIIECAARLLAMPMPLQCDATPSTPSINSFGCCDWTAILEITLRADTMRCDTIQFRLRNRVAGRTGIAH